MAENIRAFLSGGFLVYSVMSWGLWTGVGYWIVFLITSFVVWWLINQVKSAFSLKRSGDSE